MLHELSWIAILLGLASALYLAASVLKHSEKMAVMRAVWPLMGLAGGPLAVWLYRRNRRRGPKPAWVSTAIATCHYGAGRPLGNLIAEDLVLAAPGILVWFRLGSLWHEPVFATWTLDFLLAYLIGIVLQYFSIVPMRGLKP